MKTCWTRFYARSTAWKDSELLPNRTLISQMASKPWCTRWRRNAKVFATAFGGKWGRPCRNWSVYIGNKFSKLSKERKLYGETMSDPLDTATTRFFENLPPFNEVQTSPQPYSPDMYSARVRPNNESAKQPGYALLECNQNSHVRISNLAASTTNRRTNDARNFHPLCWLAKTKPENQDTKNVKRKPPPGSLSIPLLCRGLFHSIEPWNSQVADIGGDSPCRIAPCLQILSPSLSLNFCLRPEPGSKRGRTKSQTVFLSTGEHLHRHERG